MVIACLVIPTHAAAPPAPLTLETCGVTRPCGVNDTFQVLCPGSPTCTDFFKCKDGIATIERCEKPAWYVFWLAPFYNSAKKCCDFAVKICSSVHPDTNGRCPAPIDLSEVTEDETDKNVQVKRHTLEDGSEKNETVVSSSAADAKADEPKAETQQDPKEPEEHEEPQSANAEGSVTESAEDKSKSSANVPSSPFLALAAAGFFSLWRH